MQQQLFKGREAWIVRVSCLFWLCAKIISYKLWLANRTFPLVPPFDVHAPEWIHAGLLGLSIVLISVALFRPLDKRLLLLLFVLELSSCLLDQNRWQPWEYQYLFTILIVLTNNNGEAALRAMAFLMVGTYFYSGLSKFNDGYLYEIWVRFILKAFHAAHYAQSSKIYYAGYAIPGLEVLAAIGLLFRKTQKSSAVFLIAMHLFNLLVFGPLMLNYNVIIWPWNVAMIALLIIVFFRKPAFPVVSKQLFFRLNIVVVVCWGIMPALCFAGLWDRYLSASLYAGDVKLAAICIKDTKGMERLQPYFNNSDPLHLCSGERLLNLQAWAFAELKVPPYLEMRVFKNIKRQWDKQYPASGSSFILYSFPYDSTKKMVLR